MKKMYKAQVNSPSTSLINNISATDTKIPVLDSGIFANKETPLVIGAGATAETVLLESIQDNILVVKRGFQGNPKSWDIGTLISRNYTAYDHDTFIDNIDLLSALAEKVIPRLTDSPEKNEIIIKKAKANEFNYALGKENKVTIVDEVATFEAGADSKFKIKIVNGKGTLKVNVQNGNADCKIINNEGEKDLGKVSGTKSIAVKSGDLFIAKSNQAIKVSFDKPDIIDIERLLYNDNNLITDLTNVYMDIARKMDEETGLDLHEELKDRLNKTDENATRLELSKLSSTATNKIEETYEKVEWRDEKGSLYATSVFKDSVLEVKYHQLDQVVKWRISVDEDGFPYKKELI